MRFEKNFAHENPVLYGWRDTHAAGAYRTVATEELANRFSKYEEWLLELQTAIANLNELYSGAADGVQANFDKIGRDLRDAYSKKRGRHMSSAKKRLQTPAQWANAIGDIGAIIWSFGSEYNESILSKHKREISEPSLLEGIGSAKAFVDRLALDAQKYLLDDGFKEDFEKIKSDGFKYVDVSTSFERDDWKERVNRVNAATDAYNDAKEIYCVFVEMDSGKTLMERQELFKKTVAARVERYHSALEEIRAVEERGNLAYSKFMLRVLEHPGL